jgi:hypothetical protein
MDPRSVLPLDAAGWRWSEGKIAPSDPGIPGRGLPATLPHCWNAAEEYIPQVLPRRGWATYQLDLVVHNPDPDREWRLRCDGFYGIGRAWVNRCFVGKFNGDHLGIDLDVSEALRSGENRFTIQVCNRFSRKILPGISDPDFHLYGGLGGGMHLIALPRVRLMRNDCQVVFDENQPGDVRIEIGMANRSKHPASLFLQMAIQDPAGKAIAVSDPKSVAIISGRKAQETIPIRIPSPLPWSLETPQLYTAEATLREEGRVLDRLSWTFGLRTLRFDAALGFLLNGKPVVLRGVNRHENLPGFGSALPRALHIADARDIKAGGFNFVRLSHYPQSPAFLDACDRLGILVYAELCSWKRIAGGSWLAAAETQLERMIRRDRHHPSVILWGLGNEGRHRPAFLRLKALARALDPSRPTIYAENHAHRARRKNTAGLTDVWGLNYEFKAMDFARSAAPTGCVVVSECANLPYARRGHWAAEARQTALIRNAVQRVEGAGPGAAGWTLWGFADYATPRRQRWFRECGVRDGWRTAKMAAAWVQARYADAPILRVWGDWSFDSGSPRRLYLASNCVSVRMIRADGTTEALPVSEPDLHEIDLDFDGGPVRFEGRHGNGSMVETSLVPWDVPTAFSLQASPPMETDDAASLPVIRCALQVLDAHGVAVMGYEGEARVSLPPSVRASLIGGAYVPVHAGQAAFYVETPRDAQDVKVDCILDDLPPQTLRLSTRAST